MATAFLDQPPPSLAKRPLTEDDAIAIWIARWLKIRPSVLVKRYGCDPRRLYEIWEETRFPGSRGRALAEDTRKAAKAESDAKRAEAEAGLAAKIADAETQVAATKAAALANIRAVASDAAAEIYARLSGETVGAADAEAAVDATLAR